MNPDQYCAERAAQSGSSFHYSFRLLPAQRRAAITALYAFCREVDDVVDEVSDPNVARVKLAWWRTEIDAVYEGTPQHPVALALQPVVRRHALPRAHLQTIIDGMQMDLDKARYLDFAELETYCDRVAGVVGLMSAEIFGYEDPRTRDYARDLGIAFQLTNIVRDVGEDARRGRIYLPQDELARYGVAASQVLRAQASPAFAELMRFQVERARSWYERALAKLPAQRRAAITAL
ncbi:MAG TPA: presqualene diphosphate synthase HpnD, partial [Casimicrobiaceae bacterium]